MSNTGPLYDQIAKTLIQSIVENQYQEKIPTEIRLAEQFDVSVPTIKKAMTVLVENDIVTRIPGKGTFVKDPGKARKIAQGGQRDEPEKLEGKALVVGVVFPSISDDFTSGLLNGITEALAEHHAHALLGISQDDRAKESEIIEDFLNAHVDGLIIFPIEGEVYNQDIVRLSLDDFPLVLMDRWLPGIDVSRVVSENALGAERAVDYLYELGHRNIALVSVSSDSPLSTQSIVERKLGFIQSLEKHGKTAQESLVWVETRNPAGSREIAVEYIVQKFRENPYVTAVIGTSASDTSLVFEAASRLGMRIPEDISVMGYDIGNMFRGMDTFFSGEVDGSPVTWLDQSEHLIGKEGANLICRLISDPKRKEIVEVPITLRIGASCSSPNEKARVGE